MTQTIDPPVSRTLGAPPSPLITRRMLRISAKQYHKMIEDGILPEDSSTELLGGIIVRKNVSDRGDEPMGHGPMHRLAVRKLTKLAAAIDSEHRHLQIQLPLHLAEDNEPEPDGAIILGSDDAFANRLPGVKDIAAVVEVSDSSLGLDRGEKREYYAVAGIAQYIIVNLRDERIEVFERPDRKRGTFRSATILARGKSVRVHLGRGTFLDVRVESLLP